MNLLLANSPLQINECVNHIPPGQLKHELDYALEFHANCTHPSIRVIQTLLSYGAKIDDYRGANPIVQNLLNSNSRDANTAPQKGRPTESNEIILYTINGDYPELTTSWEAPNLFTLDSYSWDSVERYLMYKMYEGTPKGTAIRSASSLQNARDFFNTCIVPTARSPKQLFMNKKSGPIAESKQVYTCTPPELFVSATRAKFTNGLLFSKLAQTGTVNIINKNPADIFGYAGNLLGNTLMVIRGDLPVDPLQPGNNLQLCKWSGDYYIIIGDPSHDIAKELKALQTPEIMKMRVANGIVIPKSARSKGKEIIYSTLPDYYKMKLVVNKWIKINLRKLLSCTSVYSKFRGRTSITASDLSFTLLNICCAELPVIDLNTLQPSCKFIQTVWKICKKGGYQLSEQTVNLLWAYLQKESSDKIINVRNSTELENVLFTCEEEILDTYTNMIEDLPDIESIIITAFNKLYTLLSRDNTSSGKVCTTVINLMVGKEHYDHIRKIYSRKINDKHATSNDYRKGYGIKNKHVGTIIKELPENLGKKCILLLLISVDYINELDDENAIEISKHLITIGQCIPQEEVVEYEEPTTELNLDDDEAKEKGEDDEAKEKGEDDEAKEKGEEEENDEAKEKGEDDEAKEKGEGEDDEAKEKDEEDAKDDGKEKDEEKDDGKEKDEEKDDKSEK